MNEHQIKQSIIAIVKNSDLILSDQCISAKVLSVDEDKRTVKVEELANKEMVHKAVQLQSIVFGGGNVATGFCLVPSVGSTVLIEMVDNNEMMYHVTSQSQIDKLLLDIGNLSMEVSAAGTKMKVGACEFNVDSSGFEMKNAGITLASILLELINQLVAAQIVVTTPSGPGTGVMNPVTIAALNAIVPKVNSLLK